MEHEFTISGRIFPELSQIETPEALQKFTRKMEWTEQDFSEVGLKISILPCSLDDCGKPQKAIPTFTLKSEDFGDEKLQQVCQSLSAIFECTVILCKDHEIYGVANVFNGGSDYEVVDEDCHLWIYASGACKFFAKTKYWNEKFAEMEQEFLDSKIAAALKKTLAN